MFPLFKKGSVFWQPNQQSRISFRLTAGVWCLFALVMVNVYSSTLTAHITARKTSIPPVDPIEVMEQGVLAYLAVADGFGRELILVFSELRRFFRYSFVDLFHLGAERQERAVEENGRHISSPS
jgi:hypothetical protein